MVAFSDASLREVRHIDVRVLAELRVNFRNLRRELAYMCHNQDLALHYSRIDAERRANRECTCLTRAILALSNQVMILVIDGLADQGDRDALNLGGLDEAELLYNASNEFRRDSKIALWPIPRLLVVDERAHNVPRMPVIDQLSFRSIIVFRQFNVFGLDRTSIFLLFLFFCRRCGLCSCRLF